MQIYNGNNYVIYHQKHQKILLNEYSILNLSFNLIPELLQIHSFRVI